MNRLIDVRYIYSNDAEEILKRNDLLDNGVTDFKKLDKLNNDEIIKIILEASEYLESFGSLCKDINFECFSKEYDETTYHIKKKEYGELRRDLISGLSYPF